MTNELSIFYFFLKDDLYKKIVDLLMKYEKVKKTEVYKCINESREKVFYRLKILIENDIISYSDTEKKEIFHSSVLKIYINCK